eukprot:TRINITY_DN21335_c0_g3_i1.p1 TRINITY_DN21335_c0_g3~~TRINITY_DN21335_c0_g3_i1.p1  ORF type:complete len:289 (+),score=59.01 TRINITY_DN21335_c0_g3_i1:62-928(+)
MVLQRYRYELLLLAGLSFSAQCHFIWLRESGGADSNSLPEAVVTFGERAGVAESSMMLGLVANKTVVSVQDSEGRRELHMATQQLPKGTAELRSSLENLKSSFNLELNATFGVFAEGPEKPRLLKYFANADRYEKPSDVKTVLGWSGRDGLSVNLLFANNPERLENSNEQPGAQCSSMGLLDDGKAACVMAIVRFKGEQLIGPVNLTAFAGDGTKLGSAFTTRGMAFLRFPLVPGSGSEMFTEVFASANYHQNISGDVEGKHYDFVDNWATTYARLPHATTSEIHLVV